jgi:hypothetical protein
VNTRKRCRAGIAVAAWVLLSAAPSSAAILTFFGTGADTAALTPTVVTFRSALGDPNNGNTAVPLPDGRREINWDGGGTATTVSPTPFNGFLNIRGALFDTPGTGFVQAPPDGLATQFTQAGYGTEFDVFSPARLFSPIGSNITDVTFFIPGTNGGIPATVSAFGAVFSDVDAANTTSLQFFDRNDVLIGSLFAPPLGGSGNLSFAGASFNAGEQIFRVRITTGNAIPGVADAPGADVVMMDDFLYSEPRAVPEPTTLALMAAGLIGVRAYRKRRA